MATSHGNDGYALIGVNQIAEVQNWNYNEEGKFTAYDSIGDTVESNKYSGIKKGGGDITVIFDDDDATGQQAMTLGASVELHLTTEKGAVGKVEWTGTVQISSRGVQNDKEDMTKQTFNFLGVLTEGDVSA